MNITGLKEWSPHIFLDQSGVLTVNHNNLTGTKKNETINMWVMGETGGRKIGIKPIELTLILPEANTAPYFQGQFVRKDYIVYEKEQALYPNGNIDRYRLPDVFDDAGDD